MVTIQKCMSEDEFEEWWESLCSRKIWKQTVNANSVQAEKHMLYRA